MLGDYYRCKIFLVPESIKGVSENRLNRHSGYRIKPGTGSEPESIVKLATTVWLAVIVMDFESR